jgi:hypothetical protein
MPFRGGGKKEYRYLNGKRDIDKITVKCQVKS